eukprot:TRINITY_DN72816_c0_g1_i1.p1 TRINITY_DN72816_c0_g1~~TRINITY_DN72816_c0_g1_i1.p1  ORF type:complete len:936 (+),score=126.58 TRINITY_DN72816_c0_g1_i1:59-2866(+)
MPSSADVAALAVSSTAEVNGEGPTQAADVAAEESADTQLQELKQRPWRRRQVFHSQESVASTEYGARPPSVPRPGQHASPPIHALKTPGLSAPASKTTAVSISERSTAEATGRPALTGRMSCAGSETEDADFSRTQSDMCGSATESELVSWPSVLTDVDVPAAVWDADRWLKARAELLQLGDMPCIERLQKFVRRTTNAVVEEGSYTVGSNDVHIRKSALCGRASNVMWLGLSNVERSEEKSDTGSTVQSVPPPVLVCSKDPLDICVQLRQIFGPTQPIILVAEACEFTESGSINLSRGSSVSPRSLLLQTDIERFAWGAEIPLRGGDTTVQSHLRADSDPYVFFCPGLQVFRGSREDGYPFWDCPLSIDVLVTASAVVRPNVQLVHSNGNQTEWYAEERAHAALLDRLYLIAQAAQVVTTREEGGASATKPILVFGALGCDGHKYGRHPRHAVANALKHWRKTFSSKFESVFMAIGDPSSDGSGGGLGDFFERVINRQVYQLAASMGAKRDKTSKRLAPMAPWHWDTRLLQLTCRGNRLIAASAIIQQNKLRWAEDVEDKESAEGDSLPQESDCWKQSMRRASVAVGLSLGDLSEFDSDASDCDPEDEDSSTSSEVEEDLPQASARSSFITLGSRRSSRVSIVSLDQSEAFTLTSDLTPKPPPGSRRMSLQDFGWKPSSARSQKGQRRSSAGAHPVSKGPGGLESTPEVPAPRRRASLCPAPIKCLSRRNSFNPDAVAPIPEGGISRTELELAECLEDLDLLRRRESLKALQKKFEEERTASVRRRSSIMGILGDVSCAVVADTSTLSLPNAPGSRRGSFVGALGRGPTHAGPTLAAVDEGLRKKSALAPSQAEVDLRRQVRQGLRKKREAMRCTGGGSIALRHSSFAATHASLTDGGDDSVDERPPALSRTDSINLGRRPSYFGQVSQRNFAF